MCSKSGENRAKFGSRTKVWVGVVAVFLCVFLPQCPSSDARHVSLSSKSNGENRRMEIIHPERDAITVEEAIPSQDSALLRASYASHLEANLKKAFALQLLHRTRENQYNNNQEEFLTRKNKRDKQVKLKSGSSSGYNLPFHNFPPYYVESPSNNNYNNDEDDEDEQELEGGGQYISLDFQQLAQPNNKNQDPHEYQERYKSNGKQKQQHKQEDAPVILGEDDEQSEEKIVPDDKSSLVNSYFDNEYSISMLQKMECVTPAKSKGYCSTFRACVPSLFNSEGELEAPALAELVSMSIGYCSSSTSHLLKRMGLETQQRYNSVSNRIICCPGSPPAPGSSAEDNSEEKFNDFLAGSDSFIEQDEDDVSQGPLKENAQNPSSSSSPDKLSSPFEDYPIKHDLKGEFVNISVDTEAEVWHSEEDIKAAKKKRPEHVIPIEAFIPPDKLDLYDPHTNTFFGIKETSQNNFPKETQGQQQINENINPAVDTQTSDEFMDNANHQKNQQFSGILSTIKLPYDEGIIGNNNEAQEIVNTSVSPIQNGNENNEHIDNDPKPEQANFEIENQQFTTTILPNEISHNDEEVTNQEENTTTPYANDPNTQNSIFNYETINEGHQNLQITGSPPPIKESQPTINHDGANNQEEVKHGEPSFIKISPEPVIGANGKFNLEKGVHVEKATNTTPRPLPNSENQVNIGDTSVNIVKGEATIDSNQVFLFRPNQPHKEIQPQEISSSNQEIYDETTAYNKYNDGDQDLLVQTTTNRQEEFTTTQPGFVNVNEKEQMNDEQGPLHNFDSTQETLFNQDKQETTTFYPVFNSEPETTTFKAFVNDLEQKVNEEFSTVSISPFEEILTTNVIPETSTPQFDFLPEEIQQSPQHDDSNGNEIENSASFLNQKPITVIQLFLTDAATLSPQNGHDLVENPSNQSLFSNNYSPVTENVIPAPILLPITDGMNTTQEEKQSNESISEESSSQSSEEKKSSTLKSVPEQEIGGIGTNPDSQEYQILSSCATQDYYRSSLEQDNVKQYPYLATIVGGSRPFCSGSLISDRHILTASHFLANISVSDVFHMRVHIGYKSGYGGQTEGPYAVRKVLKVIRHKGFSFDKLLNDIAIILLDRPIQFSENVHPVCLSSSSTQYSNGGVTEAFETGWVEDPLMKKISPHHPFIDPHILKYFSFGYENITWTLQESSTSIRSKEDCQFNYDFLGKSGIVISDSMVCAATDDGKSCTFKGNSGAPLFIKREGKPMQVGIVSWGIGCGHFPAVFTAVSSYIPWIEKVVQRTS